MNMILSAPPETRRAEIDRVVQAILQRYGPDGHVDGHNQITDYILKLLEYR